MVRNFFIMNLFFLFIIDVFLYLFFFFFLFFLGGGGVGGGGGALGSRRVMPLMTARSIKSERGKPEAFTSFFAFILG